MTKDPSLLSRRNLIKIAAAAGVISPQFAGTEAAAHQVGPTSFKTKLGAVHVTQRGPVAIHTYVASERSSLVTAHIIEADGGLYLVDCQFTQSHAAEFRAYADSLGKPIRQVHVSHPHPDHFSGYARNFADAPLVSTSMVRNVMKERWIDSGRIKDLTRALGDEAPNSFATPEGSVDVGTANWGGANINVLQYENAEALVHSVIHIPEAKTLIVQDLAFSNAHFFPLGDNKNWVNVLGEMSKIDDVDLVLCGHGLPAQRGVFDDCISYLTFLQAALKEHKTADDAIAAMRVEYPNYGARGILNFIKRLYKDDH